MTIALGLIGHTGMVFAADTEESWGNDIKTATTKLISGSRVVTGGAPLCSICVTGSGNSDYLDAVKMDLIYSTLLDAKWRYELTADLCEAFLVRFYEKHVVPFWPNIEDFQLVIGINTEKQGALWGTSKAAMRPCMYGFEATGLGRPYASALLSRFHSVTLDLNACAMLAIHVICCVKEFIGGCGKQTQIVVLSGGDNWVIDQDVVDEAERILKRVFRLDSALMHFLLSEQETPTFESIQKEAFSLKAKLRSLDLLSRRVQPSHLVTKVDPQSPPPSQDSHGGSGES